MNQNEGALRWRIDIGSKGFLSFWLLLMISVGLILFSGCGQVTSTPAVSSPTPAPTLTASPNATLPVTDTGNDLPGLNLPNLLENLPTRTPEPTATPDAVAKTIDELLKGVGLSQRTLLWIQYADWINLGISLFFIIASYLIGTWLIRWLLPRLVVRTKTRLDDRLLEASGNEVRWLVVVFILRASTERLTFIKSYAITLLLDIYFFASLFLLVVISFHLINLSASEAENRIMRRGRKKEADPLITLTAWTLRFVTIIFATTVSLSHFGVNITGLALLLGIIGLVISLAGRDVLADIISGAIILIDRPYRVGDRIELPSLKSWGDVYEIGMRSTKVKVYDNRMIIFPNSVISKNEIINYSYPDPSFYDEIRVMVAYDNDVNWVGKLIHDTIGTVDGVDKDQEIISWLIEFQENCMVFIAGWWIRFSVDRYRIRDRVTRAIIEALKVEGVVMPYRVGSLDINLKPQGDFPIDHAD